MTQANTKIKEEIEEERYFHDEEDVQRINWWIPEDTYDHLRDESIGASGTTQHMGQIVTEAIAADMQTDSDNTRHQTWQRLKEGFDYSSTDYNVQEWSYKSFVDYTKVDVDKKALSVSVPQSIVRDFTKHLDQNGFGDALANALDSELWKRKQIRMMHKLIDQMHGRVNEVEARELDVNGTPIDTKDLRMTHTNAEFVLEHNDVDYYQSRRGAIMAELRNGYYTATKGDIYGLTEKFGASSRPTKRKDYLAIIQHTRENDAEKMAIHPCKLVRDALDTHNLPQYVEYKTNNVLVEDDKPTQKHNRQKLSSSLYNSEVVTRNDAWGQLINPLAHYTELTVNPVWIAKNDASIGDGYKISRAKADALPPLKKALEAVDAVLEDEDFEGIDDVTKVVTDLINAVTKNLDAKPDNFEEQFESKKKRDKAKHTNDDKRSDELRKKDAKLVW